MLGLVLSGLAPSSMPSTTCTTDAKIAAIRGAPRKPGRSRLDERPLPRNKSISEKRLARPSLTHEGPSYEQESGDADHFGTGCLPVSGVMHGMSNVTR
jgi:hypothetical protein